MRVGVIGTGFGRTVVAPVFAETPGCEVADVVTPRDAGAVAALCARADVDLISVHSPPFLHAANVRAALAAGHHALCDKPFAMSAGEAESLVAEARAAGVLHFVNFEFRRHEARNRLRDLVRGGAIGEVERISYTSFASGWRRRRFGWLFTRETGGGWIGAWGSHMVDGIRWMFGEIAAVEATLYTTITERPDAEGRMHPCDADDGFTARLALASGAVVTIDTSFTARVDLSPRMVVIGSEGAVEFVAERAMTVRRADGSREEIELPRSTSSDPHLDPMRAWAADVRDAVREGRQIEPSFADGAACDRVLDMIRAGRRVVAPVAGTAAASRA